MGWGNAMAMRAPNPRNLSRSRGVASIHHQPPERLSKTAGPNPNIASSVTSGAQTRLGKGSCRKDWTQNQMAVITTATISSRLSDRRWGWRRVGLGVELFIDGKVNHCGKDCKPNAGPPDQVVVPCGCVEQATGPDPYKGADLV